MDRETLDRIELEAERVRKIITRRARLISEGKIPKPKTMQGIESAYVEYGEIDCFKDY